VDLKKVTSPHFKSQKWKGTGPTPKEGKGKKGTVYSSDLGKKSRTISGGGGDTNRGIRQGQGTLGSQLSCPKEGRAAGGGGGT